MITENKLDFWMNNNLNVLIEGRHGTGKSTMIMDAVKRNKLKWLYYSASTMDVFTDFLGVPKEKVDDNGKSYLEFIQPKRIADDDVEFLFFDEFNRAKPKVTNAVMELIQFKSLNGRKFKNLRMVWAAINPEGTDDEYAVEKLDPAHKDRFHIIVKASDNPDASFFKKQYGENGKIVIGWYNSLPAEIKSEISPRRLSYALDVFNLNGDISDVLPYSANTRNLIFQLSNGSIEKKLKSFYENNMINEDEIRNSFNNNNFFDIALPILEKKEDYLKAFCKFIPEEKFAQLIVSNGQIRGKINKLEKDDLGNNIDTMKNILSAKTTKRKTLDDIKNILNKFNEISPSDILILVDDIIKYHPNKKKGLSRYQLDTTQERKKIAGEINKLSESDLANLADNVFDDLFLINCSIGSRTYGKFCTTTVKNFNKFNNVLESKNIDMSHYLTNIMKNKEFLKYVGNENSSNGKRLINRLEKLKLITSMNNIIEIDEDKEAEEHP